MSWDGEDGMGFRTMGHGFRFFLATDLDFFGHGFRFFLATDDTDDTD